MNDNTPGSRGKSEQDTLFKICVLCGEPYQGYGNNPWPMANAGRCCDQCNLDKVLPARLKHIK